MAVALEADLTQDVFMGTNANEQTVKSRDLSGDTVLAFATHGLILGNIGDLAQPALAQSSPDMTQVKGFWLGSLVVALLSSCAFPSVAAELAKGGAATVAQVVDGDTVVLDDTRQVRLVGIQAPKLPLGRKEFKKWPLADTAKKALEGLVLGRTVELRFGGRRIDRYRRVLAHLFVDGETWVQGALLRAGMARVYTFSDNREWAAEMYDQEKSARDEKRGVWSHGYYDLRRAENVSRDVGSFQVVEGRVLTTARVRSRVFLNFGPDWRTDFTVVVPVKKADVFRSAGIDPLELQGRQIRVRGWIRKWNGPLIDATHPEQIEVIGDDKP